VGGAVTIAIFGALLANRTQLTTGMQTRLNIAAVPLLATVVICVRNRPTDHRWQPTSNESKETEPCKSAP
jgi:hypothetical protein